MLYKHVNKGKKINSFNKPITAIKSGKIIFWRKNHSTTELSRMQYRHYRILACCWSTMSLVSKTWSSSDNANWRCLSRTASRLSNTRSTSRRELAWFSPSCFITACTVFRDCRTLVTGSLTVCNSWSNSSRCLLMAVSVSCSVWCSACSEQNPQNIVSQSRHNSVSTSPLWLRQTWTYAKLHK